MAESPRPITVRHPLAFIVGTTITLIVLLGIAGTAIYLTGIPLSSPVPVIFLPIAIGIASWATLTKRWQLLGFRGINTPGPTSIIALMPLIIVAALTAATTGGPAALTPVAWLGITGLVLLVAFVEETVFRSIFIAILRSRGTSKAIVVSTIAFSLAHSVNVLTGQDLDSTIRQIVFALAFGLAASCVYLHTGSIWPTLIFHVIFNFIQLTSVNQTPAIVDWIMTAIMFLGAGWLWSGITRAEKHPRGRRPVAQSHSR
ncbi:CPBP family intramembrane glutamic endopeptidase [Salinibacterium sp. NK8237]|uniref:CPBP family intramembrane glutamic endopeptidase n=1 Tax=Salinibacterium sp. NK8237 TaxID=2792038 RepID=UPI0018CCD6B9|nr:type II CAAX endopeptidase family protein [Salinibacterium sp. NK8237]MBH0130797.1 CPBP family intramembrane metalloprotease [Salinibacterium sp. NK8237]